MNPTGKAASGMLLILIVLCCTAFCLDAKAPVPSSPAATPPATAPAGDAKNTLLGFAVSPAHMPTPGEEDLETFFGLAAQHGSHVTLITEWKDGMSDEAIADLIGRAHARGLKCHLYLSPVSLDGGRKTPAVPAGLGGTGFRDDRVRTAYRTRVLELAALRPDVLGLGTEVNLLEANPDEYEAYASLTRETYRAIKARYPGQTVTISFQWDTMIITKNFGPLRRFADSLDVYSFTTYPGIFKDPATIPGDYYSCVRVLLPAERLGFSEAGWSSGAGSSPDLQAQYYARLPELMKDARPEYVTLGLMHDVNLFSGDLETLNSVGVRNTDGCPKKSWGVVTNLSFDA